MDTDAFGRILKPGDKIVYYSGDRGALHRATIERFIYGKIKKYGKVVGEGITGLKTTEGSTIRNFSVVMKENDA